LISSSLRDNVTNIICPLILGMFSSLALIIYLPPEILAQHHGAPPPAANIGDRKISLIFDIQPDPISGGQNADMHIGFADENAKKNVSHVTFRMDISKDGKHILSEFFHSHQGEVSLSFKDIGKATSTTNYTVGANSDVLTNAWIADPGSPIIIREGEIFSQPGTYKVLIELTTMDNDKTDLPQPIPFESDFVVS
jgi:hypothetical protein